MALDNITVRQFMPEEWELYKAIRLKALATDPAVFGATYSDAEAYPDQRWIDGLTNPNVGIFGVFFGDRLIGMTGIAIKQDDPGGKAATLWGSWIEPSMRSKGVSKEMYTARLDWGRRHPQVKKIIVSHREGNIASKNANQKQGFVFTHAEDRLWHDGKTEKEFWYELQIKR